MDLLQVDNVLDAIGREFVPASIDLAEFDYEIGWAFTISKTVDELSAHAEWKAGYAHAEKIRHAGKRLSTLLSDENGDWVTKREVHPTDNNPNLISLSADFWSSRHTSISEFRKNLDLLIRHAEKLVKDAEDRGIRNGSPTGDYFDSSHSTFEQLVGEHLAEVYREFICREPGVARTPDGKAGGPYVRFISAVLKFEGITYNGRPYATESIATAWAKAGAFQLNDGT